MLTRTRPSPHRQVPFDLAGQSTAVLAMSGLTYGVIEAGADGFTAPQVLIPLGAGLAAMASFLLIEARVARPVVPLEMFRNRTVVIAVVVGFTFMIAFYGLPFVFSLYFQQVRGLSSMATGLAFVPMMAFSALLNPVAARLVERIGRRTAIIAGLLLMVAGMVALAALSATAGGALAVAVFGALLADQAAFLHGVRTSRGDHGGASAPGRGRDPAAQRRAPRDQRLTPPTPA